MHDSTNHRRISSRRENSERGGISRHSRSWNPQTRGGGWGGGRRQSPIWSTQYPPSTTPNCSGIHSQRLFLHLFPISKSIDVVCVMGTEREGRGIEEGKRLRKVTIQRKEAKRYIWGLLSGRRCIGFWFYGSGEEGWGTSLSSPLRVESASHQVPVNETTCILRKCTFPFQPPCALAWWLCDLHNKFPSFGFSEHTFIRACRHRQKEDFGLN